MAKCEKLFLKRLKYFEKKVIEGAMKPKNIF